MYGAPLTGEEQKIESGTYAPGQEAVIADMHVRGPVNGKWTCLDLRPTLLSARVSNDLLHQHSRSALQGARRRGAARLPLPPEPPRGVVRDDRLPALPLSGTPQSIE